MLGSVILCLAVLFAAVVIIRTLGFKPQAQPPVSEEVFDFDQEKAVDALAQLVRCKTISYNDKTLEADEEFEKAFGRKADKRRKLYNGMIKCQVYMYFK